jgi:RNA polymerase primary sigma factor
VSTSAAQARYFTALRKNSLLPPTEELDLARQAKSGCSDALERLLESNLGFVVKVSLEYRNSGLPLEDLFAEGSLGLIEAVKHYDPSKGLRFITYAVWWIRKSILVALSDHANLVKVPNYRQRKIRQIREIERRLEGELGRKPRRSEIASRMSGRKRTIEKLLQHDHRELSLDVPTNANSEVRLLDRIADSAATSPEDEMIRREARMLLREAVSTLGEREQEVITRRFGLGDAPPLTLTEIGNEMGLSRERVRQIEVQVKTELRRLLRRRHAPRRIYAEQKSPLARQPKSA